VFSLAKLSAGLISNTFDVLDLKYHDQININLYKQDSCQPSLFSVILSPQERSGFKIAWNECICPQCMCRIDAAHFLS
jgi:hypothetical protein